MKIIYVAGAYRAETLNGIWENIMHSRREALKLWFYGWAVISPHCNSIFMDGEGDADMFLEGDLEILKRCDAIYMLSNFDSSEGAQAELRQAKRDGLEVYFEGE